MRTALLIVTVLWWTPRAAAAQADAGAPPPRAHPAPTPSLSPDQVAARAGAAPDSIGPIDATEEAIRHAEGWLADGQRRDAIHHGVVDGWYSEVGRSMRGSFHPDLVAITDERRRGMSLPEIALDELARYGPPEAPRGPASVYTPEMAAPHPEDPSEVQAMQQFEIQSMLNAHTRWQRVEVHVIQDRTGHVLSATVTHSSDSHTLDTAAIDAITSAAIAQPPPATVLGERQTIDSDWSFWAGEVVPYVGQAGCIEGADGQGLQCSALGRPLLRTRVVLLDVHDAEHERAERAHGEMEREHPPTHERAHATHERTTAHPPRRDVSPDLPTHALAPPGAP
jgi:TonB family protein